MKRVQLRLLFVGLGLFCISSAQAQKNIPAPASGESPSPPLPAGKEENVAELHIALGPIFDNGAVYTGQHKTSDIRYSFLPSLSLTRKSPRFMGKLNYGPGVTISQHRLYADRFSQVFGGQMELLPSKRTNFSLRQEYLRTTDPFAQLGQGPFMTTPALNGAPNQTLVIPNYMQTQILSFGQLSYLVGEHTSVGVTGQFADREYKHELNGSSPRNLLHAQIDLGAVFLSHQISRSETLGIQYEAQNIKILQRDARTFTHSFILFNQYSFTPHAQLFVYGGSSYSLTLNQVELVGVIPIPVRKNSWSPSGGATFSLQGDRHSFKMQFSRRVTDGQGLLGAVYLNYGSVQFSRRLTPRCEAFIGGQGSVSDLIALSGTGTELRAYGGRAGFKRQLSQSVAMSLYYERINQTGSFAHAILHNHDIVGFSLEYTLLRPLGR